jgi:hypothetical protein
MRTDHIEALSTNSRNGGEVSEKPVRPGMVNVSTRIPPSLAAWVAMEAERGQVTTSEWIRLRLEELREVAERKSNVAVLTSVHPAEPEAV